MDTSKGDDANKIENQKQTKYVEIPNNTININVGREGGKKIEK